MVAAAPLMMAMTALSTGMGMLGALQQGKNESAMAKHNADIADENADRARHEGSVNAQEGDMDARQEMGALIAGQSASGFQIGAGSLALQRKSLSELAAKDRETTKYNAEVEATDFNNQANVFRAKGKMARKASKYAAMSSLISGASKGVGLANKAGYLS